MAYYQAKPEPWALDPALTERPDFWRFATVVPLWERRGGPRRYGIAGNAAIPVTLAAEGVSFAWNNTGQGKVISSLDTTVAFNTGKDSQIFPTLAKGATFLVVTTPRDTTLRASVGFCVQESSPFTNELQAHMPYSDGTVYWDYGGFSAPNRVSWAGYSKTGLPFDIWAFRAGPNGMCIFHNGTRVANSATAVTRTRPAADTIWLGTNDAGSPSAGADLLNYHLFAAINQEWPDAQIIEWSRDPFVMLRRAPLFNTAAAVRITSTNISAAAIAVGSAAVTVDRAQLLYPDSDVSAGAWTTETGGTTNLYASIDETPDASDSDYIQSDSSPTSSSAVTIGLSDPVHTIGTGVGRVSVRYYKKGSGNVNLTVRLMDGSTEVASWTYANISESVVRVDETLSAAQVASITSGGTNLRLKYETVEA